MNLSGGDGAEVIYSLRNSDALSKRIAKEIEGTGQNVRKYYQRRLPSNPAKDYYYIMRDTPNNETVIVEYGFVDSTGDDVSQLKNNWQDMAEAVVKAVTEYVGGKYVPATGSISTDYYIVKKGDSLYAIASKYNTTVDELVKLNNLKNTNLSIGQYLKIPNAKNNNDTEVVETEYYTVKSGDTLWSIARKYNLSVDELKKLNNLTSNALSIGQKLIVNKETPVTETTHTVTKGDTLYGIANKYNTTVDELKRLNNLTSNTLSIGQVLKLPATDKLTYTVKKGDTLYAIANTYGTSVDKIKELNNLSTNALSVGQTLILPK